MQLGNSNHAAGHLCMRPSPCFFRRVGVTDPVALYLQVLSDQGEMLLASSKVDLDTGQACSFAALYLLRPGAQGACSLMARRCDDRTQQPVCLRCD